MTWTHAEHATSALPIRRSLGCRRACAARGGFTLVEALMACGILLIMVVAVTTAVTAGQHHAHYAQQRIAGTLAAEELMGQLQTVDYHSLATQHRIEPVGTIVDVEGEPFPNSFRGVGREYWVTQTYVDIPDPRVQMNGKTIRVRAFDDNNLTLADVSRFVVEPRTDTLNEAEAEAASDGGLLGNVVKKLFGW